MEKIDLNISVHALAEIQGDVTLVINAVDGKRYLDKTYKDIVFELDYPLGGLEEDGTYALAEVKILKAESIADILVPIAKYYQDVVYNDPKKYGVWGHRIEDLFFEGVEISESGETRLIIGS